MAPVSNIQNGFQRSRKTFIAFASLAVLMAPSLSFAQSVQDICPKGYSIFETVCLDEVTGDVVNQSHVKGTGESSSPASNPITTPAPTKSGG